MTRLSDADLINRSYFGEKKKRKFLRNNLPFVQISFIYFAAVWNAYFICFKIKKKKKKKYLPI